jgi:hypothetical protein
MGACKFCKSSDFSKRKSPEDFYHNGNSLTYEFEFSICNVCHREFLLREQIEANELRIKNAMLILDNN